MCGRLRSAISYKFVVFCCRMKKTGDKIIQKDQSEL